MLPRDRGGCRVVHGVVRHPIKWHGDPVPFVVGVDARRVLTRHEEGGAHLMKRERTVPLAGTELALDASPKKARFHRRPAMSDRHRVLPMFHPEGPEGLLDLHRSRVGDGHARERGQNVTLNPVVGDSQVRDARLEARDLATVLADGRGDGEGRAVQPVHFGVERKNFHCPSPTPVLPEVRVAANAAGMVWKSLDPRGGGFRTPLLREVRNTLHVNTIILWYDFSTMSLKSTTFQVVFTPEIEGGFTATVPALPGCISHGATLVEARDMIREAILGYLESLLKHNEALDDSFVTLSPETFVGTVTV